MVHGSDRPKCAECLSLFFVLSTFTIVKCEEVMCSYPSNRNVLIYLNRKNPLWNSIYPIYCYSYDFHLYFSRALSIPLSSLSHLQQHRSVLELWVLIHINLTVNFSLNFGVNVYFGDESSTQQSTHAHTHNRTRHC